MENAGFQIDVQLAENVLHEVFLPQFERIVQGGVTSAMSAYNSVNSEWCGQNHQLLTEILRKIRDFDGFLISDFLFDLRNAPLSVKNGLIIAAPFSQQRAMHLEDALQSGELDWSGVERVCIRIFSKQLQSEAGIKKPKPDIFVVFCEKHRALAREAAQRSMVLLNNDE